MGNASFADMLGKTKTTKPKAASKSTVPVVEVPDEIKEDIDAFQAAKKDKKVAEAEMKVREASVLDFGHRNQDEDGFRGRFRTSYQFNGVKDKVKYVSTNRFSINSEDSRQIKEILGSKFDTLMDEKHDVKLKPEVFTDEALQSQLMEAVGEDFGKFFETVSSLNVVEGFDGKVYQAVDKDGLFILRTFVRPYKPSLR